MTVDYAMHYDRLISRARSRQLDCYVERHHVIPKCMGGDNNRDNLVSLTPEEHYVAHQLLVKINPGNRKLVYAAWGMTHGKSRSNKKYGWLRRKRSDAQKGVKNSEETRRKISESNKGRILSPANREKLHASRKGAKNSIEHNKQVSEALRGKPKTEEHKKALSVARLQMEYSPELREKLAANRGKKMNDNQRAALIKANKGRPQTEDHKRKVSMAKLGKNQPKVICPHCHKEGGSSLMKRWHFDNCKVNHG